MTGQAKQSIGTSILCKATESNGQGTTKDTETKSLRESIKQQLLAETRLYNKKGNINANIKRMLPELLVKEIESLYTGVSFGIAVYCVLHDISQPVCKLCSNTVLYYNKAENVFSEYCSIKCSRQGDKSKQKRQQTKLTKYGHTGYNNREKAKETCLLRYGVENVTQTIQVKEKLRNSANAAYASGSIKEKRLATFQERYNGHPQQTNAVKQKKINNTLAKYGVEHTTQLPDVINKIQAAKEESYVEQYKHIIDYVLSLDEPALRTNIARELNESLNVVSRCIEKYNLPVKDVEIGSSTGEKEIIEFLQQHNIQVTRSDRTVLNGKELDIYLPDYNLAIEFNGVYWHSEKYGKLAQYHINKTQGCASKGIQLLHIWDIEWNDPIKQDIWKSMILSKLGIYKTIIYARKTIVRAVDKKIAREFLNANHLSGASVIKDAIGLYYNNELVMIATFAHSRYSKQINVELTRLCTKRNCIVIGGASKLFANQPYDEFVSYANLRYSNGNVYNKTNMQCISQTKPNYWYIVGNKLENRLQYQKHKLSNKLDKFYPTLTEHENMHINGYYRVWDCGNLTYIYKRQYD